MYVYCPLNFSVPLSKTDWPHCFFPQVLLRFPWCLLMVQCLQSMCLLDTFRRYEFRPTVFPVLLIHFLLASQTAYILSACFPVDHRREWSAAGSGFTSATGVPPCRSLPSPPPSASTTCPPACLHPTPCHDGTATPPLHRHGRRCGWHEFPVHLSISPSTHLLRAGWVWINLWPVWIFLFIFLSEKPFNCCIFVLLVSAESHPQHGRPPFVHRDDRTNKAYERLQKKLKDRQGCGGGGQVKDSPPSSPQKSCSPSTVDIHNGVGAKVLEAEQGHLGHAAVGSTKQPGRGRNGEVGGKRCLQLICQPALHRWMFVYVVRIAPYLLAVKDQTHSSRDLVTSVLTSCYSPRLTL